MSGFIHPSETSVLKYLEMLFGDDVKVTKGKSTPPVSSYLGVFLDDEDALAGGCVADINFAAYAGAALTILPKGVADDAIKSKEITEVMSANLGEVFNILTRVVVDEGSDHLRYQRVVAPGKDPSVSETFKALPESCFTIQIPNYGQGQLSFFIR